MSQERLIKKYANRRLYDASQSRHITLDDIRTLIIKGEKIKVVEDKTGHDITRHILLQVIAEQEQFGRPILSTPVLESIIRFYGSSMQGFLASFLEKSIETFLRQQETLQSQLSKMVANTPLATVADLTRQNLETLSKIQETVLGGLRPNATNNDVPGRGLSGLLRCNGRNEAKPVAHELQCASASSAPSTRRSPRPADWATSQQH